MHCCIETSFWGGKDKAAVDAICLDLPNGVTALVDKCCHLGGLKYLDKALYSVFALIEKAFSVVATQHNFYIGGNSIFVEVEACLFL